MDDEYSFPERLDISPLLKTNHIPTDREIEEINDALTEPLAKLKNFEQEMKRLDLLREEVNMRHLALCKKVEPYRVLISHARRLHVDILREVFVHCLPTTHNSVMSNDHPPLLLTRVCRRWRDIAFSTPRLWASIHIPVPSPQRANSRTPTPWDTGEYDHKTVAVIQERAAAVRQWLLRSGACPLDITFHGSYFGAPIPLEGLDPSRLLISSILEFSSRWRRVEISLLSKQMADVSAIRDLPLLESLAIDEYRNGPIDLDEPVSWSDSGLLSAQNLRRLSFRQSPSNIQTFPVQWSQLDSLTLTLPHPDFDVYQMVSILKLATQLKTCEFELPWRQQEEFDASCPSDQALAVSLRRLESFTIHDGGNDMRSFFGAFTAPSLQNFVYKSLISPTGFPTRGVATKLTDFFSRSPSIRKLTIDPQLFTRDECIQFLRLCPQITYFAIRGQDFGIPQGGALENYGYIVDDDFLKMFVTPGPDGEYLCPLLDEFHCTYRAGFTDAGMLDFITSKQDGSTPQIAKLKRMNVKFNRPLIMTTGAQTQGFVDDGLKLDIRYYGPHFVRGPFSPFDGIPVVEGLGEGRWV